MSAARAGRWRSSIKAIAWPVPQILRPGGLSIGVVAGPQNRDEHLRLPNLASLGVRHRNRLTGIIHERLFSGAVFVPQNHVQTTLPCPVKLAVPAIGVAQRIRLLVLFPQKLKGYVLAALQFPVNRRAVRQATFFRQRDRRRK